MSAKCKSCGACCRAIFLPKSYSQMIADTVRFGMPSVDSDVGFVLRYWNPISVESAFAINPNLKKWDSKFGLHFYTCILFDSKNNRCSQYDKRPRTCSGYPWYEHEVPSKYSFYSERCAYKKDIRRAV